MNNVFIDDQRRNDLICYPNGNGGQQTSVSKGALLGLIGGITATIGDALQAFGTAVSISEDQQQQIQQDQQQQQVNKQLQDLQQQIEQLKQQQQQQDTGQQMQQQIQQLQQQIIKTQVKQEQQLDLMKELIKQLQK